MPENQPSLAPNLAPDGHILTKRERRMLRRQEREREQTQAATGRSARKIGLWVLAVVILAGTVYGLYKLATIIPPPSSGAGSALADPVTAADWTTGNAAAKTQLVEYGDFQCPACYYYAPLVQKLRQEFPKELGVTYREFPLRQNHANAQIAAQVAEAAGLQGHFWDAVDVLYDHQHDWDTLVASRDTLVRLVQATGVTLAKLKVDIDSKTVKDKIERDLASGLRSGVEGTPTFFLNGKKIENPKSYDDFKQLIIAASSATTSATSTPS